MRRREFIALLGGVAAWPLTARAQPADKIARIGFFGLDRSVPIGAASYQAFVDEMKIHGFTNDQNLVVDFRRLEQDSAGLSSDMAELVQLNVNALVTQGTEPALKAAIGATRTSCCHDSDEPRSVRGWLCEEYGAAGWQRNRVVPASNGIGRETNRTAIGGCSRPETLRHSLGPKFDSPI